MQGTVMLNFGIPMGRPTPQEEDPSRACGPAGLQATRRAEARPSRCTCKQRYDYHRIGMIPTRILRVFVIGEWHNNLKVAGIYFCQ